MLPNLQQPNGKVARSKSISTKVRSNHNQIMKVVPIDGTEEIEEYYKEYEKRQAYDNDILDEKWAYKRKKVTIRKDNIIARSRKRGSSKLTVLRKIQTDLDKIVSEADEQHRNSKINEEWKILAKVLDRIFFGIFLLTVLISSAAILAPAYYHRS